MTRNPPKPIRLRFAPSPTGRTHLGSGRTALYNYLLARQNGGQFILRIEDTDQKRYNPQSEVELIDSLHWLGIDWDEGPDVGGPHAPYHQSQRKEIYQQYAQQLIDMGKAYFCFCSPERLARVRQEQLKRKDSPHYDGTCRRLSPGEAKQRVEAGESHVIRFKTPQEGTITVHDRLRGEITVENINIDDYIIVKSDGLALYHLAAMVDDHLMGITHVIRGSEWLPTFPLHVHIIRALGWEEPEWIHLSLFLKPSGKGKMSKRDSAQLLKDGFSIYLTDLRTLGYIPEGVVNWTTLMGWSFDDHTEFFTMQDLIEKFNIDRLNPSPAAINFSKLDHFNGLHIRNLQVPDLAARMKPFFEKAGYVVEDDRLIEITPLIQPRIVTLEDAPEIGGIFFEDEVHPQPDELVGKNMSPAQSAQAARRAHQVLQGEPEITPENAEIQLRALASELELSAGQLFGILRSAVTGRKVSPPLFQTMAVFGKDTVLQRIDEAVKTLEKMDQE
jgi:glutamyl-tRNA synthetase